MAKGTLFRWDVTITDTDNGKYLVQAGECGERVQMVFDTPAELLDELRVYLHDPVGYEIDLMQRRIRERSSMTRRVDQAHSLAFGEEKTARPEAPPEPDMRPAHGFSTTEQRLEEQTEEALDDPDT